MKCPICGQETTVYESREAPIGTRRRRKCLDNHRFTTYEVFVDVKSGQTPVKMEPAIMAYAAQFRKDGGRAPVKVDDLSNIDNTWRHMVGQITNLEQEAGHEQP